MNMIIPAGTQFYVIAALNPMIKITDINIITFITGEESPCAISRIA
jgi:hypothetical protein